ncbi:hypothetical protein MBLNU230_g2257t1 [Neophaeotheca triangularis]
MTGLNGPASNPAKQDIAQIIAAEPALELPALCAQIHARLNAFLETEPATDRIRSVQDQSRTSLKVIEEALSQYSLDELSLSYNGGKDCLVLLILYLSALHSHFSKTQSIPTPQPTTTGEGAHTYAPTLPSALQSVYIESPDPFPALTAFVDESHRTYHLDLHHYPSPMRLAFSNYLAEHSHVKAIFVGTRRTDPHGSALKHFDPTDRGWPDFMRIHPVIDWRYADVWCFLRELGVGYCGLYDEGYTSLGGVGDTWPNPRLKIEGEERWRPAFELVKDEEERLGRATGR